MPSRVTLTNRFPEIIAELPVRGAEITLAISERVAELTADAAPVETGALKGSIKAQPFSTGVGRAIVQQAAVTMNFYYYFLEYGTVNMDARPFVIPATEQVRHVEQYAIAAAVLQKL